MYNDNNKKGGYEMPSMFNNTYYTWTTGGGFSNYTAMPGWQKTAVNKYLQSDAFIPPDWTFSKGKDVDNLLNYIGISIDQSSIWKSSAIRFLLTIVSYVYPVLFHLSIYL